MSPEQDPGQLPEWVRRERVQDLRWIGDNLHVFVPAASAGHAEFGRGALVVNTLVRPTGRGNPIAYVPRAVIETGDDEDFKRMVRDYDPNAEFVILLLKTENRTSTYRVWTRPRQLPQSGPIGSFSLS